MSKEENNKVYFKGLNGLRFFAALAVIITHIELLKGFEGLVSYWKNPLFFNLGSLGVYFFFVLSGFLITYLLLTEKKRYNDISVKKFYIRRILRIWPLYYFIVFLGFFVLPQSHWFDVKFQSAHLYRYFSSNLMLYVLILPNLALALYPVVPNIGQTWSIGVEEQFYIIWPVLIAKSKNVVRTLLLVIVVLISVKVIVLLLGMVYVNSEWYKSLKLFVAMSKFECMAIGGIGAYMLFTQSKWLVVLQYKSSLLISILLIVALIYFTPEKLQDGIHIIYAVLFLTVIIYCSTLAQNSFLDNVLFNYLGNISYGIYMYHFMVIPPVIVFYKHWFIEYPLWFSNIFIYLVVFLLTILIAAISYYFFEKRFINMKDKFSPIKSGMN